MSRSLQSGKRRGVLKWICLPRVREANRFGKVYKSRNVRTPDERGIVAKCPLLLHRQYRSKRGLHSCDGRLYRPIAVP